MIVWQSVGAAFLWGCGVVFVLEGWRRNRPLWALWALLPVAGGMWVGMRPSVPTGPISVPAAAVAPTAAAEEGMTLRPPVVSTQELMTTSLETPIAQPTATFAPPRLQIPSLGLDQEIVPVPIRDGRWDVSTLGGDVGWLEATGTRPGEGKTPVFVGHMTFADERLLEQGAFATLQELRLGAEVWYWIEGERYLYTVTHLGRVEPDDVDSLFTADGETLLLLTCTDWSEEHWAYENRLLVRARLQDRP